jgi:signal transduction histidine kinase
VSGWTAAIGWLLVAGVGGCVVVLRARLELAGRAEHELRGSVTVLCLVVERLRRDSVAVRHAAALELQLDRLRAALADLAAARGGPLTRAREERLQLALHLRSAVAGWLPVLRAAGRRVTLRWEGGASMPRADRGRVAQALGNVIANAVEHGEGPIEIAGRELDGKLRVEVRNRTSTDAPNRRHEERRGRGLRIATSAARSLGGHLEFRSEGGLTVAAREVPADRGESQRAA